MADTAAVKKTVAPKPARLHVPAIFTGFRRSLRKRYSHTAVLKLRNVNTAEDAKWYLGKRVAFSSTRDSKPVLGRVIKVHGPSGLVKAKFNKNLPPTAISQIAKVFLYPSQI